MFDRYYEISSYINKILDRMGFPEDYINIIGR